MSITETLPKETLTSVSQDGEHLTPRDDKLLEFLEATRDGRQIAGHAQALLELSDRVSRNILGPNVAGVDLNAILRSMDTPSDINEVLEESGIRVGPSILITNQAEAQEVGEKLENQRSQLQGLAKKLMVRPDLRLGERVKVSRNPQNGETGNGPEEGWVVTSILASGKIEVERETPEGVLVKKVTLEELESWNPADNSRRLQRLLASAAMFSR